LNSPLFVTFNYEEWPLAAHIEIYSQYLQDGLGPIWIDLTGSFRDHFEFPLSSLLNRRVARRKLARLFPERLTSKGFDFEYNSSVASPGCDERAGDIALQELISRHRNSKPCLVHNRREYQKNKALYSKVFQFACSYLEEIDPDHVVLFNGRFVEERAFWDAAKLLGIPVKFYETFIDSWVDRYHLFQQPTHSPSYRGEVMLEFGAELLEANPTLFYDESTNFFESRMNGESNKYTAAQDDSTTYGADKPIISFFHSSQDELVMVDLVDDFWESQEMAVLETVNTLNEIGGFHLVLRIHPHLLHKANEEIKRWNEFGNMLASKYDWFTYIPAHSASNSYDLIKASRLVITCASTVGVEASYFGKPSILLGRAFHESMGITQNPRSSSELRSLILSDFTEIDLAKSKLQALKYGVFLSVGGKRFSYVVTSDLSRRKYEYRGTSISKSVMVRLIQKFEIQVIKLRKRIKSSVLCSHDCWIDSR
jgi:hypothetical protein